MKNNHNQVWIIVSNNVPVEAYEDEFIAQQVASEWNKHSSAHVTYYKVPLVSQSELPTPNQRLRCGLPTQ
ncbi:MAG: hypothetical protein QNJ33_13470 [Crocosphaera sp.]|nr:hypothetical protein [Crocosphaera sp.]